MNVGNSPYRCKTPVAFIIFNRPETTARVFAEIAKAGRQSCWWSPMVPGRIDREKPSDARAARAIIKQVDWDCEVLTNFSEVNLGCKRRVSSGIDWVFEQVEEAIILEDDCLPDPTFFRFCQEMLERYRHDQRIGMIGGDNFQFGRRRNDDSYYFSKYIHIWGWASWRDRWAGSYDVTMAKWPRIRDEDWLADMVGNTREAAYWQKIFERVHRGEIDTWDYQWVFANWLQGRMSILPSVNMITNVGFDGNATHTKGVSDLANLARHPIGFPLTHPLGVIRNIQADKFSEHKCFRVPLTKRVRNRLIGLLQ